MTNAFPQRLSLQAFTRTKGQSCQKSNNPLCCAERRLLSDLYKEARNHGIAAHKVSTWIHRKFKHITIIRETSFGLGKSFPCVYCRSSLERLDMRVTCVVETEMECVRIAYCDYESKLTTGQMLQNQPIKPCMVQSNRHTRRANKQFTYNKPGKK